MSLGVSLTLPSERFLVGCIVGMHTLMHTQTRTTTTNNNNSSNGQGPREMTGCPSQQITELKGVESIYTAGFMPGDTLASTLGFYCQIPARLCHTAS